MKRSRLILFMLPLGLIALFGACRPSAEPSAKEAPAVRDAAVSAAPATAAPASEPEAAAPAPVQAPQRRSAAAIVQSAAALLGEAEVTALEAELASLPESELETVAAALEAAASRGDPAVREAPGIQLALAFCYGRRGLAARAYAAVERAEVYAKAPGVAFSLAAVYGRKALLAGGAEPCALEVESDPPGALIVVDGKDAGIAPLRLEGLRPGSHRVQGSRSGYDAVETVVEGTSGSVLKASLRLVPAEVECTVRSEPKEAELRIGGMPGSAPGYWTGKLRPGVYAVEGRHAGYKALSAKLEVPVSALPVDRQFRLEPLPATIKVESEPSGARVMIDGRPVGTTPLITETMDFGTLELRLQSSDWRYEDTAVRMLSPVPGGEIKVMEGLAKRKGRMVLPATPAMPAGAVLSLNGRDIGRLPLDVPDIEYGEYALSIRADRYETLTRSIRWEGDSRVLPVMLKSAAFEIPWRTIAVDGNPHDWDRVLVAASKPYHAGNPKYRGSSFGSLTLARDHENLYFQFIFYDSAVMPDGQIYAIDFDIGNRFIFVSSGNGGGWKCSVDEWTDKNKGQHKEVALGKAMSAGKQSLEGYVRLEDLRFPDACEPNVRAWTDASGPVIDMIGTVRTKFTRHVPHFFATGTIQGKKIAVSTDAPLTQSDSRYKVWTVADGERHGVEFDRTLVSQARILTPIKLSNYSDRIGLFSDAILAKKGHLGSMAKGTVTISSTLNAMVSGTFDLTSNIGDVLKGSFCLSTE